MIALKEPSMTRRSIFAWTLALGGLWMVYGSGEPASAQATVGQTPSAEHAKKALEEAAQSAQGDEGDAPEAAGAAPLREYEWLTDEDGNQYRVEAVPKLGARIEWLSDGRLRYGYRSFTVEFEVLSEDEESFFVKIPAPTEADIKPWASPKPTPEELAAVAAKYVAELETVDRLEFRAFSEGLPRSGQWRNIFDVADMNGDGHMDIVHGPPRKGGGIPAIILGDGKGGWKMWSGLRFPSTIRLDYGAARAGDFNGDGHMDIALAMHLHGLTVMVGDGKGTFELWSEGIDYEIPGQGGGGGFSSRALRVVDWNKDGRPDLLALGEGPRPGGKGGGRGGFRVTFGDAFGPLLFLNRGDGTWERHSQGNGRGGLFGDHLAEGDFNGDGQLDFVTASGTMNRRDLVHLGAETGEWAAQAVEAVRPRGYVRAVTSGDFNKDGLDDVALAYLNIEIEVWRTGIDILYARKDGGWDHETLIAEEGRRAVTALTHGDLNGDGALDLVGLTGDGDTWIFLGDGEGGFQQEVSPEIHAPAGGCQGYHVQLVDLNGDGKDEIISGFAGEPSALFAPDRCKHQGEMQAWAPTPVAPAAAAP
jgi:hypothetical protein